MSETYRCGDHESLVAYVYDECEPAERQAIAAHIAVCASCAAELESLGDTRSALSAWTPPDVRLGFQITERRDDAGGARVLRPAVGRWWQQPLPAWAQAAAALLIFASGIGVGAARSHGASPAPAIAASTPAAHITPTASVTPQDLAAVEQRLRGEIAQIRQASTQPAAASNDAELLRRVQTMIADSEQRQRQTFAVQTAQVVRSFDAQRRVDLAQVQRNIGQIQEVTGSALRGQTQMVNYLMNVSQQK